MLTTVRSSFIEKLVPAVFDVFVNRDPVAGCQRYPLSRTR
jgi:hypothetical protein